ncbi:MAG: SDR family oxidoreductase [Pseudomonadota bacterium]
MERSNLASARATADGFSVHETYNGRHLLIAGASGFLGKVWLSMALDRLPQIGRIYVMMRKRGVKSARARFEEMLSTSFVFEPLHRKHGSSLSRYLSERVEIIEGDLTKPNFGMATETAKRIRERVDLLINCAGLVEFNPDIREALSTNLDGTAHFLKFADGCDHAALLHVSTCFVAGTRQGKISETIDPFTSPSGKKFDVETELAKLRERITSIVNDPRFKEMGTIERRRAIREAMIAEGTRRAEKWGWQNTYTYTKGMAEMLLARRQTRLAWATFRPAIVESAVSYPFPGWNEGFNTCGPLTYLLGTWFRYLPAKIGNPFDIVPVDTVASGMLSVGAALLNRTHAEVYQCGTSDLNLLTIDRACRLTSLSHRLHYRQHGKTLVERLIRSHWNAVTVADNHPLTVSSLRTVFRDLNQLLGEISRSPRAPRPIRAASRSFSKISQRTDRKLEQISNLLELFMPFIHDNHHVFETRNLKELKVEEEFRFQPETLPWRDYWLNIHMPGLRRWSFPLIERKRIESFTPETPVHLEAL